MRLTNCTCCCTIFNDKPIESDREIGLGEVTAT